MLKTKLRRNIVGGIALLAIFFLILGPALIIMELTSDDGPISTDSGISACKRMAENVGKDDGDDTPWTEADYFAARAPFESSKHADIKVAGTNIVDAVYELEKAADPNNDDLGSAMVALNTVQTRWAGLQTACANHGVTVPALPAAA
jgi:hypothetical protein